MELFKSSFALPFCALMACGDYQLVPRWEMDGLAYYSHVDDTSVCEDVLPVIAARRRAIADFLGIPMPVDVSYFKYYDTLDLREYSACTNPKSSGCFAFDSEIHSNEVISNHELVHDVSREFFKQSSPFTEGLATALSCGPRAEKYSNNSESTVLQTSELGIDEYIAWSAIVAELLRREDAVVLQNAHEEFLTTDRSMASLDEVLVSKYGVTHDELWQSLASGRSARCIPVGRCDVDTAQLGANAIEVHCDGPKGRVLDASLGGALGLIPGGTRVNFLACDLHAEPSTLRARALGDNPASKFQTTVETLSLAPQSPHLIAPAQSDDTETSLHVRTLQGSFLSECPKVGEPVLEPGPTGQMLLLPPADRGHYWFHIGDESENWAVEWVEEQTPGVKAWLCEQCPVTIESLESTCRRVEEPVDVVGKQKLVVTVDGSEGLPARLRLGPEGFFGE